jgi:hypothetical protein
MGGVYVMMWDWDGMERRKEVVMIEQILGKSIAIFQYFKL